MENAQKFLEKQVKQKTIDEVRGIRERDEERERVLKEAIVVSMKLPDDLSRAMSAMKSSMKLSDDTLKAIQAIKSWNLTLKKDIEKAEDSNLSTDFEPKEIDEKDYQKEK